MKRIISLMLCAAICFGLFSALPCGALDEPKIVFSNETAAPGDTVSVTAALENNPGIIGLSLKLEYDEGMLELSSVELSSALGGSYVYAKKLVWGTSADVSYNGDFLTLTFKVKEGTSGSCSVSASYNAGDICNYDEEDINFSVVAGSVTIAEPSSKYTLTIDGVEFGQFEAGETVELPAQTGKLISGFFARFYNYSGADVVRSAYNKSNTVNGRSYTLVMPEEDTELTTQFVILGNLYDRDTKVNARDTAIMKKLITNPLTELTDMQTEAADLQLDGKYNSRDTLALKKLVGNLGSPSK